MGREAWVPMVLALVLLAGCSPSPDLSQCQLVAEIDSELVDAFDDLHSGDVSETDVNSRLDALSSEYLSVDVEGELKVATTKLGDDLRALVEFRESVARGAPRNDTRAAELLHAVSASAVAVQSACAGRFNRTQ